MKTYFILQSMSTSKDINFAYTNAEITVQMIFNTFLRVRSRAKMQLFEIVEKIRIIGNTYSFGIPNLFKFFKSDCTIAA